MRKRHIALCAALLAGPAHTQGSAPEIDASQIDTSITSPKSFFGKQVGADRFLANYTQMSAYWRKIAQESPRMTLEEIGKTSYGQTMLTAIVTSPGNQARIDELRRINERICRARDADVANIDELIRDGKPVIWIDAGMHATESVAAQNIIELAYRLCARRDAETLRILDRVVCLITPANPDGMELIASAYGATGRVGGIPVLYQRYIGHDNNRDYYAVNMPETRAICRMLYKRWYPQVVYNHHQTAPRGTILFTPPFRDPFNYNVDPLVVRGIEIVAAHMNTRFTREDKAGVISRSGAPYSTWWNGGLRTTAYFHNMIGILTEAFGHPTPRALTPARSRRVPYSDYPLPIGKQKLWHARQTIEYLQTANYAILDYASRYGDEMQADMWRIGRRAIAKGRSDHRTVTQKLIERMKNDRDEAPFRDAKTLDPRAYLIPRQQEDFAAATRLARALHDCGVEVERLREDWSFDGRSFRAGSLFVRSDQAFRAHVLDMFEPQWHPDDIAATGEPIRPYDSAGWTLAMQMGVAFVRIYENVQPPADRVTGDQTIDTLGGEVAQTRGAWLLLCENANAYRAVLRLMKRNVAIHAGLVDVTSGAAPARFAVHIPKNEASQQLVPLLARELGLDFEAFTSDMRFDRSNLRRLRSPRVGLFDVYGGHMATGWAQWILESFDFDVSLVDGERLTSGRLDKDFDILIFLTGLPSTGSRPRARPRRTEPKTLQKLRKALPPFEDWSGIEGRLRVLTKSNALDPLRSFVRGGGAVLGIGDMARRLVDAFDLPFRDGIRVEVEDEKSGRKRSRRANRSEFFIPGSLIRVRFAENSLLGNGHAKMPGLVDDGREQVVMFRRSPVFSWKDGAPAPSKTRRPAITTPILYADEEQLASGWAIGEEMLRDKIAAIHARVGKGQVFAFGPDMLYRGQPWASYHPVFRAILLSASKRVRKID